MQTIKYSTEQITEMFRAANKIGRAVPDISADADPSTGYIIRFSEINPQTLVVEPAADHEIGRTSASTPLCAALMLRINGTLGHPVGFLNPFLYEHENDGISNDVTTGNNGYSAAPGLDPVTGLGSINGTALLNALQSDGRFVQCDY